VSPQIQEICFLEALIQYTKVATDYVVPQFFGLDDAAFGAVLSQRVSSSL